MPTAKEEIRKMLDGLPDDASWEDVQYSIYVRERIDRARIEASQEETLIDQDEIEARMNHWLAWPNGPNSRPFLGKPS